MSILKKTSPETRRTLEIMSRAQYSNFDELSEADKESAMLIAAENIRTFIKSWVPSKEIENYFEWCDVPWKIAQEAFKKLIEDLDRDF